MRTKGRWIATAVFLLFLFCAPIAWANSAAPVMAPGQTAVYFDSESGIQLIHEDLLIDLSEDLLSADYNIVYQFHNVTEEEIKTPIWFLTSRMDSETFEVVIDGESVDVEALEVNPNQIENWDFGRDLKYRRPWDQGILDVPREYGYASGMHPVMSFVLTLQPGESVQVEIAYMADTGYVRDDAYFGLIRTSRYYLSPASFYEGDAEVDIQITVPEGVMVGANIPIDQVSQREYQALGHVLGEEDLFLTFLDKDDLFLGTYVRRNYYMGLTAALLALAAMLIIFRKRRNVRRGLIIALIIGLLGYLARPTYGMMFLLIFFGIPIIVIALLAAGVIWLIARRRKQ